MKKEIIAKLNKSFEEAAHVEHDIERSVRRNPAPLGAGQDELSVKGVEGDVRSPTSLNRRRISPVDGGVLQYWMARDIQVLLEYNEWRNFLNIVEKAKIACGNSGQQIGDHFGDVTKMVQLGSGSEREIPDIMLSRFNVKKQNLSGEAQIAKEHIKNNQDVRKVLAKSHIYPEELPPEEDVKKLERRLKNENEKFIENPDVLPELKK
jgi:hypothetical protein